MLDIQTKLGDIKFSPDIVNKIAAEALNEFGDDVNILNFKGRYKNAVPGLASKMNLYDEEAGGIESEETSDGIMIKVYVVIRFGISIRKITSGIIDRIYEDFEKTMGVPPAKVTVAVTGVQSKNTGRRYIEVSR